VAKFEVVKFSGKLAGNIKQNRWSPFLGHLAIIQGETYKLRVCNVTVLVLVLSSFSCHLLVGGPTQM
jgi:hypothetical protein